MTTEINGYGLDLIEQVKKELHSIYKGRNILNKNFKSVIDIFNYFSQDDYYRFVIGKDVLRLWSFTSNTDTDIIYDDIFELSNSELMEYVKKGYTLMDIKYEFIKNMKKNKHGSCSYIYCISVNSEDYFIYDPDTYE